MHICWRIRRWGEMLPVYMWTEMEWALLSHLLVRVEISRPCLFYGNCVVGNRGHVYTQGGFFYHSDIDCITLDT